jgi:predicted dehydrogenase
MRPISMKKILSRRSFLQKGLLSAAGLSVLGRRRAFAGVSPNEKLNIGMIGVQGRAADDLNGVASQNIVAFCDIDDRFIARAASKFPSAQTYTDYRKLLERNDIDAVVVGTPDHTHAVITMAALKSGRHVYCEKPLARTIAEVRAVTKEARERKLVTQMGTQIHAGSNYRRVVELVQSGAIGTVREVHVWVGASYGNVKVPTGAPPVPAGLHYDLWLGPVEFRPYEPEYLPFSWRNFWAFGGGSLADMACHHMDLSHWALGLDHPVSAEAEGPELNAETTPPWLIVRYQYPERESAAGEPAKPPVKLTWYHGGKRPPHFAEGLLPKWGDGNLFVGEKGMLLAGYDGHVLLPEKDFAGFTPPPRSIPESIGHHKEWIEACKGRGTTTCRFDYSGPLAEAVLLGNVAFRAQKKLEWDTKALKAMNCPEADTFIQYHYRNGWSL